MITNHSYPHDKCTFELLSAYLDGEVTAQQREEVTHLLATNPEAQELYSRLLSLRHELNNLPVTITPSKPLCDAVFAKIDQQNRQRRVYLWRGGAIATVALTTIFGVITGGNRNPILQMAQETSPNVTEENLVIALNEPIISINTETQENLMIPLNESVINLK